MTIFYDPFYNFENPKKCFIYYLRHHFLCPVVSSYEKKFLILLSCEVVAKSMAIGTRAIKFQRIYKETKRIFFLCSENCVLLCGTKSNDKRNFRMGLFLLLFF